MKWGLLIAVIVVAALTVVFLRDQRPAGPAPHQSPSPTEASSVPAPSFSPDQGSASVPAVETSPAEPLALPEWTAEAKSPLKPGPALESVRLCVRNYGLRFKGNPVGNNAEITAALNGDNPQGVRFLDANVHRVNGKGELVDGWGTPYFFHQLAGDRMEIRSAGADRILWTLDDLVMR